MVDVPATVYQIKECLSQGQAVVLGIPIFNGFIMAPNGRVPMPAAGEADVGGHALLVVGYEEEAVHLNQESNYRY